ncbi:hypothetical protein [Microbispora rosea]|uniref:hypothetical protein n=1 Tax=Microbispora rosea TaxID=58117 RepID=UPI003408A437
MGTKKEHFVRYELWDGPPEPLESWEVLWNGELRIDSGTIALSEYYDKDEWEEFEPFDLGETGVSWSVRVLTRVMTNTEEPDFPRHVPGPALPPATMAPGLTPALIVDLVLPGDLHELEDAYSLWRAGARLM